MNEMTSVTTNGSWVTMIMKISAGSSGARRAQSPARTRSARFRRARGVGADGDAAPVLAAQVAVLIARSLALTSW